MFSSDINNSYHALAYLVTRLLATGDMTHYNPPIMQSDWMEWTKYGVIMLGISVYWALNKLS